MTKVFWPCVIAVAFFLMGYAFGQMGGYRDGVLDMEIKALKANMNP